MRTLRYVICALFVAATTPEVSQAAGEQWQVGTTPSFSSGTYGTDERTEVFYTPLTARRNFAMGDLTVVFPFTCISGNRGVTVVNGTPVPLEVSGERTAAGSTTSTRTGSTTTTGRTGTDSGTTLATTAPAPSGAGTVARAATACGMGDIVVRGRYYLVDEHRWMPTVAVRAHLKTPTADAEAGLGTGRADEGVGIEVSRSLGSGFMVMVDGGYTVIGKPSSVELNNSWWYGAGIGQDLAGGVLNLSVFFEEYRAIVPGLDNAKDVLAAMTVRPVGGWRIQLAGEFGVSDGAPDHGITVGVSRSF